MSELTFAKSFLATLDKRSIKLAADHVSDPRQYPSQSPYTLPKLTTPFPTPTPSTSSNNAASSTSTTTPSQPTLLTAVLKPTRALPSIPPSLPFPSLDPKTTTVHDLKTLYADKLGLPGDKVKVLYGKKPVGELKTLEEVVGKGGSGEVEFGVMLLGGVVPTKSIVEGTASVGSGAKEAATVEQVATDAMDIDSVAGPDSEKAQAEAEKNGDGQAAKEMLKGDEFWEDLRGFLGQRLRDDGVGEKLAGVFKEAWKNSAS